MEVSDSLETNLAENPEENRELTSTFITEESKFTVAESQENQMAIEKYTENATVRDSEVQEVHENAEDTETEERAEKGTEEDTENATVLDESQAVHGESEESQRSEEEEEDELGTESKLLLDEMPEPDEFEVEEAILRLLERKVLPLDHVRDAVAKQLNRKLVDALAAQNYDDAERYDEAGVLLGKAKLDSEWIVLAEERSDKFDADRNKLDLKLRTIRAKWERRAATVRDDHIMRLASLEERHHSEKLAFRRKWQDETFIRTTFYHPSQELIRLRMTEKKMALSKCYDEAMKAKAEADELQAREENASHIKMNERMEIEYRKLLETQEREIVKMEEIHQRALGNVEKQKLQETRAIEYAMRQLNLRRNAATTKKNVGSTVKRRQVTPRTMSRLIKLKNERRGGGLRVAPLKDSVFEKLTDEYVVKNPVRRLPYK